MPLAPEGKAVGMMLPDANGAAVTLLGLMSAGRVPAMINFTASTKCPCWDQASLIMSA